MPNENLVLDLKKGFYFTIFFTKQNKHASMNASMLSSKDFHQRTREPINQDWGAAANERQQLAEDAKRKYLTDVDRYVL